jgi:hypothetical protein
MRKDIAKFFEKIDGCVEDIHKNITNSVESGPLNLLQYDI